MWYETLFYLAFMSQAVLASGYYPSKYRAQLMQAIAAHPVRDYPALYPDGTQIINDKITMYLWLNRAVLALGVVIALLGLMGFAEQWPLINTKGMVIGYFLLQFMPTVFLNIASCRYFKLVKDAQLSQTRKASTLPRTLSMYLSQDMKRAISISHILVFCALAYFTFNPFDGFDLMGTLLGLLFLDTVMFISAWVAIKGKKRDPLQSEENRQKTIATTVKYLAISLVIAQLFITLNLIMSGNDARYLSTLTLTLYFQLCLVLSFSVFNLADFDFESYRKKAA